MKALKPYPEYKDTEVEWLRAIPATWKLNKFRHIFRESSEVNGRSPVGQMLSVSGYRGVEVKQYDDDNQRRTDDQLETYRVVRKGQLAVNTMWLNYAGLGVSELDGYVSPAYRSYWIREDVDRRFVHHLLRSSTYVMAYTALLTGVRPNSLQMSRSNLMAFPVLLPPLDEQRAIASFLDYETAEIDAFIADQQELIALLNERRAATITQAVTKGLDPIVHMKDSGVEWLGAVPEHWAVKRLSWLFQTISSGTTPPATHHDDYYGGDINWVTTGELRESAIFDTGKKVTREAVADLSALRIYGPGTLLIAMYGATIGRLGYLERPAATNQACCAFSEPRDASVRFVYYALLAARAHLIVLASGGGQPNINQDKLRSLRIGAPARAEQQEIANHLDRETAEIDAAIADAKEAIELSKERRAGLSSAAVTGKIDVREHPAVKGAA